MSATMLATLNALGADGPAEGALVTGCVTAVDAVVPAAAAEYEMLGDRSARAALILLPPMPPRLLDPSAFRRALAAPVVEAGAGAKRAAGARDRNDIA